MPGWPDRARDWKVGQVASLRDTLTPAQGEVEHRERWTSNASSVRHPAEELCVGMLCMLAPLSALTRNTAVQAALQQ